MRVEQQRGLARRVQPVAVHVGERAGDAEDLDVLQPALLHQGRDGFGGAVHLGMVEAGEGHRRDARELLQVLEELPVMLVAVGRGGVGGGQGGAGKGGGHPGIIAITTW
jgi:hypothetical protein